MVGELGAVLTVARKSAGMTQLELAERVGVTQATINRYERDMRTPDDPALAALARVLGVTVGFLRHGQRFIGALGVDAHMRRQRTERASVWRRLEARLNVLRLHASLLFEEVSMRADQLVPTFDPYDTVPADAARLVRAQWRMPIGPVGNLVRWLESAGCMVFEEDFGTGRVDGLSQWVGDHPVILLNEAIPPDRQRLTLAHELGHLVLHSDVPTENMEDQANEFAAEFLLPDHVIKAEFRKIEIGRMVDLKREWGVSLQALVERAYELGLARRDQRADFYRTMTARGWRIKEPVSDELAPEHPQLASHIGETLKARGMSDVEIAELAGFAPDRTDNPFHPPGPRLRAVANRGSC